MASVSFNPTAQQIALDVLVEMRCVDAENPQPTQAQVDGVIRAMDRITAAWQADGLQLWSRTQVPIPLTQGIAKYNLGLTGDVAINRPLKILQAWIRTTATSQDQPMNIYSQDDYWRLGNKTSQGSPVQLYYDPQLVTGQLYLYPTPDAISASTKQVFILYQRPLNDIDVDTDTVDFPQEWERAIFWGTCKEVMGGYGLPQSDMNRIMANAKESKDEAMGFDVEFPASISLKPEWRQGQNR